MSLEALTRRDAATSLGVVPVWSRPEAFAGSRPVVLAIQGLLAGPDDLSRLPEILQPIADAALVRMPGSGPPLLADPSLEGFAQAVGEAIAQLFPARPVVVLGVSIGAVAALAVQAQNVRRIVAVEPPLFTGALWPLEGPLRAHLRDQPKDAAARELFGRHFGLSLDESVARDYRYLLQRLCVPADVLFGGESLEPARAVERFPSLVGARERAMLAALPQVRLHLARGAGHNVQAQAPKLLKEVLFEACRRASAEPAYKVGGLDEALVEATPLSAARVLHWGPGARAFAGAYLAWNPTAVVDVLGDDPAAEPDPGEAAFDALVLGAPPPPALLDRLSAHLRPGGWLVARWTSADGVALQTRQAFTRLGLTLGEPVDAAGTGVLRARKGGPAPAALQIDMVAFASYLMDVRTRLPARGLRSDPELAVEYLTAPHTPRALPFDAPKVLLMQRPAAIGLDQGRRQMAYAIARGWVVVLEYDDHPGLVAEAHSRPFGEAEMIRFSFAHALQTTTEPLAKLFQAWNPEVRIFENAVFELAPFPAAERPRQVFYGAIARGGFGVEVARSLAPVAAEFPDLAFTVLGDRAVFEALPGANKLYEDYLPYEAYLARMAQCAVSLSPIEALPMRETKSDAKFLDAARAGVLTIASPLIYERVIRHGENGLLAPRLEDWAPLLRQALAAPDQRRVMTRRAWEEVRATRMFARQIPARRDWYYDLWARRDALNEAAFARIPGLAEAVAAERAGLGA